MRKFLLGVLVSIVLVLGYSYFKKHTNHEEQLFQSSQLIEKEVKNVSKLVVSEGSYAKIYNYENKERFIIDLFSARKKALIVVNATASVSYDLRDMQYQVNPTNKTLVINYIPKPELSINPDIQYYDVTQDYLNQFTAKDYNKIKKDIQTDLDKQIRQSVLMKNAENRLVSELQKLFVLTNSMNWKLIYQQDTINTPGQISQLKG